MPPENDDTPSLRDAITSSMDAIEQPSASAAQNEPATSDATTGQEVVDTGRARDQQGRFAPQQPAAPAEAAPVQAPEPAPSLTTWRKEYLPIQQKLANGEALTPEEAKKLADYNVQREREYSTGISTYKGEAQRAKELHTAMAEFMPALQQHNIEPAQWIQNLGRAHTTLAMGSPEQKLQMFAKLAQDYGVPLAAIQQAQQGQIDPVAAALMAEIQSLKQGYGQVTNWQRQVAQAEAQKEVAKFADPSQFPHFEQVRETMVRLLDSGFAQHPDQAYAMAVRMDEQAWSAEQQRQAAANAGQQSAAHAAVVAKAKQSSGSVRSTTPGVVSAPSQATDRRAALAEALESAAGGRV